VNITNSYLRIIIFSVILFFVFFQNSFPKDRIIIKLSKKAPTVLLNSFYTGNFSKSGFEILDVLKSSKATNSKKLFDFKNSASIKGFLDFGFDRIYSFEVDSNLSVPLILRLSKDDNVEYVQKLGKLTLYSLPNDPYLSYQYYLSKTSSIQANEITLGDTSIVIGVIDSGLDFSHPDLQNSFKINSGEYGNGKESNGIDDDNDGYIDNWRGWNFIANNNNPEDDNKFSHGSAVTGIISAGYNNGIGISSISPSCKVLVLKAFDENGIGDESNAASAILYAVLKGARIINCSFGDYIYSNLLRDVIRFAYSKNIVLICSAGNDGSNRLHYPSAFDEVISVGSSDDKDMRSSFSSYGVTVDIFAPGSRILTTSRKGKGSSEFGNDYFYTNGTSFAAPVISSAAALLLSKNKNLSNEEVRGILISGTDYLSGQNNWSYEYASGRCNLLNTINSHDKPSVVRIYSPYQNLSVYSNSIPVVISAAAYNFESYSLIIGTGEYPNTETVLIKDINSQVIKDSVYNLDLTNLPDTSFTLSLALKNKNQRYLLHSLVFYKDSKAPLITYYDEREIYENDYKSFLFEFSTNKPTLGKIFYRKKNTSEPYSFIYADFTSRNIGYISSEHSGLLSGNILSPGNQYEYYVECIALNGKTAVIQDTGFVLNASEKIYTYGVNEKPYSLPYVQTCSRITDINNNGKKDVFVNSINENLKMNVYEFNGSNFIKISNNNWDDFYVARDIADINGNGKPDLLTSKSRNGAIFESPQAGEFPTVKILSDELNNNFWSSRYADVDNDNANEILSFGLQGLRILKSSGITFQEIAVLPYAINGAEANSQNVLVEDFNNNGKKEIVFAEQFYSSFSVPFTGISIYRHTSGNIFERIFADTLYGTFRADNLTSGDIDGDLKPEIVITIGSPTDAYLQTTSTLVYKFLNGKFEILTGTDIINLKSDKPVSTKSYNYDNSGKDVIGISVGNNYYIFKYNSQTNKPEPVFFKTGINAVNQLVYDFDNNGINEIGLNTASQSLRFFEKQLNINFPLTPGFAEAYSLDSNKVFITYSEVQNSDYYKIYKASDDSLKIYLPFDSTSSLSYIDANVQNLKRYAYKITAVNNSLHVREGKPTDSIEVFVHGKVKLISAEYMRNGNVMLTFSGKVKQNIPEMTKFILNNQVNPSTIAYKSEKQYLLNFPGLQSGNYTIKPVGLRDFYNSPVDTFPVSFNVSDTTESNFYITKASVIGKDLIQVEFNRNTDTVSVYNFNNYSLEPFGFKVTAVERNSSAGNILVLRIKGNGVFGATGNIYTMRINNIYSENGIKISSGAGSMFSFSFVRETLDDVAVYPNPYSKKYNQDYVTFANLTKQATIFIFDLTGKQIAELSSMDSFGGIRWNLKLKNGSDAPTGIYIFRATGKNSTGTSVPDKIGKFAIVR